MDIMSGFVQEIEAKSGQPIGRCYQCAKCTAGCPTVQWFDWPNHGVIRKVQMGAKEELLASRAIWMCIGCETCGTRCPNDIYISRIMDALRNMALDAGVKPAEPAVTALHHAFVGSVAKHGRVHELSMLVNFKMKTRDFFTDMAAGLKLFLKGKIPLKASNVKAKAEVDRIFAASGGKR
jgi:heterodisulfide reductase subunit C